MLHLTRSFAVAHSIRRPGNARSYYQTTADFINYSSHGKPSTTKVSIRVGDPEEAYVMIPPEVGHALQAGSFLSNSFTYTHVSDRYALTFFHDTQHFARELSSNYARLQIPINLPRQTDSNSSPATLFLYGKLHTIALDGTSDAKFAEMASTSGPELGPALEKLKDL